MTQKKTTNKAGAVVMSIAGLTAAAVGAYYLYGHKDAAKNRAKIKGWMLKAKGDVIEELEKAKDVTESAYMGAVDAVVKKYNELKTIDPGELGEFMTEMKDHWSGIQKTLGKAPTTKKAGKTTKKTKK